MRIQCGCRGLTLHHGILRFPNAVVNYAAYTDVSHALNDRIRVATLELSKHDLCIREVVQPGKLVLTGLPILILQ